MTQRKFSEIKQTVYDYNKWKGPAVIYFNIVDGQFWTNATNLLDPKWPRKPTGMDVVIVSKDFPSRKIKISIEEVKSMAENVLKEIENNEKTKDGEGVTALENYDEEEESKKEIEEEIDIIFEDYCINKVRKCILRYMHKGRQYDLFKARKYIDFLIRSLNGEPILGDEDDEEAWTCWACRNNGDFDRVVTRTYKE